MNQPTLFDKIIAREIPSCIVWEDDNYAAFLTPFANTPGVTVVVPKKNPGDYVFALDAEQLNGFMQATKTVARLLEKALEVERVALVFEGEAVPHVHAKLYPMHNMGGDRSAFPKQEIFMPSYPGFITTIEGPKMGDVELQAIQDKIKAVASNEN